jgi:CHRD domain-containing protein
MSRRRVRLTLAAVLTTACVAASIALVAGAAARDSHDNGGGKLRAHLVGFGEVPPVNSAGHADLRATVTPDKITFVLTYADLSGVPAAAHIHVGQPGVNGGVSVFFCGGGGKPACPASTSGTVTGTIVAADVVGPTAQGFQAGDLAALERAIQAGVTYANMHTANFPNGEIRGQVRTRHGHFEH